MVRQLSKLPARQPGDKTIVYRDASRNRGAYTCGPIKAQFSDSGLSNPFYLLDGVGIFGERNELTTTFLPRKDLRVWKKARPGLACCSN